MQGDAQVAVCLGIAGPECYRASACGDGFVQVLASAQCRRQVAQRLGIIRPKRNGLAIGCECFIDSSSVLQGVSKVAMRLGKPGPKGDGPAACGDGGIRLAHVPQDVPEVAVRLREIRFQGDRSLDQLRRGGMLAALMGDQAAKVQCVGMIGMLREHLLIENLALREPASLVVLESNLQRVGSGNARHERSVTGSPGRLFIRLFHFSQEPAEVLPGSGVVGPQGERFIVGKRGFVEPALVGKDIAKP